MYISLPPVVDEMLDALLATGLYGHDRNAVVENLVLDQIKRLATGRGPMSQWLAERAKRFRDRPEEPPPECPPERQQPRPIRLPLPPLPSRASEIPHADDDDIPF